METHCTFLPYEKTFAFKPIVTDYVQQAAALQPFYQHPVSLAGVLAAIAQRQAFNTNRTVLVQALTEQYQNMALSPLQQQHLANLANENTFTVTTAHQPNIFTGPLYFIYKIVHAIQLAKELSAQLPQYNFVPVYYMGSEDADLDELGYINLNGEKLVWNTQQTGAVGRMKIDEALVKIIQKIAGEIGIYPFGTDLVALFNSCYTLNKTIQQATLELVDALFGNEGLLVVVPDNALLKQTFNQVVTKELTEQFSHQAVANTITALGKHYKVQAGGRELNLFYLIDDKRERIELRNGVYTVSSLHLSWSLNEILEELANFPERFSANVILRGVFQETILPNIAFIGGGGELAYWLELKEVFAAVGVPYPLLLVRNSFILVQQMQQEKLQKLGFSLATVFSSATNMLNQLVTANSTVTTHLTNEIAQLQQLFTQIQQAAAAIDGTLVQHAQALQTITVNKLQAMEKKLFRAQKRKFEAEQRQIQKLKNQLFPNNNLQERVENFAIYYAQFGQDWLKAIYQHSKGLTQEFGVIVYR